MRTILEQAEGPKLQGQGLHRKKVYFLTKIFFTASSLVYPNRSKGSKTMMNAIYSFWQAINSTDKNGWKGSSSWYNSMWLVKLVKIPLWDPKHSLWCVEQWMWILQTKIAYTCISKWEQSNLQHIRTYVINMVDMCTAVHFGVQWAVVNCRHYVLV